MHCSSICMCVHVGNFTWNFGDGTVLYTTNISVIHTYTAWNDGYHVTLTATNKLSTVTTTTVQTMLGNNYTTLCVESALNPNNILLSSDSPQPVNGSTNVTVTVLDPPPRRGCYMLNFGDTYFIQPISNVFFWGNLIECQYLNFLGASDFAAYFLPNMDEPQLAHNSTFMFSHVYYQIGRTQATLYAANRVSNISLSTLIIVTKMPCWLPLVDLKGPLKCTPNVTCDTNYPAANAFMFLRSSTIGIQSNVTFHCPATSYVRQFY
jgi:hypothetical protein